MPHFCLYKLISMDNSVIKLMKLWKIKRIFINVGLTNNILSDIYSFYVLWLLINDYRVQQL